MASISLSLGLNSVDPAAYNGWDGQLNACEQDARDMTAIAQNQGYDARTLLSAEATSGAVLGVMHEAALKLRSGDRFLLTYSGHGGQVPDVTSDEKDDMLDETWCLYDRMLLDDELYAVWSRFRKGVRILVLSDSCHSGTVARAVFTRNPPQPSPRAEYKARWLPWRNAEQVYLQAKPLYDSLQFLAGPAENAAVRASVILISGCQDHELSYDGPRNGAFTENVLKVWNDGSFQGSHREFHTRIATLMSTGRQHPNFFLAGAADQKFESARPFGNK
jgi:metacaspase-1